MNKKYLAQQNIIEYKQTFTKKGAVVAFPTDTVWGLGCLPYDEKGVEKIYNFKERESNKPLILLGANFDVLKPYIDADVDIVEKIIDAYMPGALTLVVKKSKITPNNITSGFDTIGIRIPKHPVFIEYLEMVVPNKVLATTSANLSDEKPALIHDDVIGYFEDRLDFILDDYGVTCSGVSSTVASLEGSQLKILRQGDIDLKELKL